MTCKLKTLISMLTLATLLQAPVPAAASAPDLLNYQHENLATGELQALEPMRGKASLLLFFQPDCDWCFRQTRVINGLLESCPDTLGAAALGVHGNRLELKRELKRMRPQFSAYKTGKIMQQELNGVPATPVMLLTDSQGLFLQVFTGYIPGDQLNKHLGNLLGAECAAASS